MKRCERLLQVYELEYFIQKNFEKQNEWLPQVQQNPFIPTPFTSLIQNIFTLPQQVVNRLCRTTKINFLCRVTQIRFSKEKLIDELSIVNRIFSHRLKGSITRRSKKKNCNPKLLKRCYEEGYVDDDTLQRTTY